MRHFKIGAILVLFIAMICSCTKEVNIGPINIQKFTEKKYSKKIKTIKLDKKLNNQLGFEYEYYKIYLVEPDSPQSDLKESWGNTLVTGINKNDEEKFVYFYTELAIKSTEIFGKKLVGKSVKEVFNYLETPYETKKDSSLRKVLKGAAIRTQIKTEKDNYAIFLSSVESKIIYASVFESKKFNTFEGRKKLYRIFVPYMKKK